MQGMPVSAYYWGLGINCCLFNWYLIMVLSIKVPKSFHFAALHILNRFNDKNHNDQRGYRS